MQNGKLTKPTSNWFLLWSKTATHCGRQVSRCHPDETVMSIFSSTPRGLHQMCRQAPPPLSACLDLFFSHHFGHFRNVVTVGGSVCVHDRPLCLHAKKKGWFFFLFIHFFPHHFRNVVGGNVYIHDRPLWWQAKQQNKQEKHLTHKIQYIYM